jgi:hypothetical protein
MSNHSVTRYVATYVDRNGMRTLMTAARGRNTFATAREAQAWIDAVTAVNGIGAVNSLWGDNPRFAVRACPCRPGRFDPRTVWFD